VAWRRAVEARRLASAVPCGSHSDRRTT